MKKLSLIALIIAVGILSCKKNDKYAPVCDGSSPTYDSYVSTVISSNCLSCHGSGSSHGDFTSYANLSAVLNNGSFEKEVLQDQSMPKNNSLSEETLDKLQCWVNNGFPEN